MDYLDLSEADQAKSDQDAFDTQQKSTIQPPKEIRPEFPPLVELAAKYLHRAFYDTDITKDEFRQIINQVFLVPNTPESFAYIRSVRKCFDYDYDDGHGNALERHLFCTPRFAGSDDFALYGRAAIYRKWHMPAQPLSENFAYTWRYGISTWDSWMDIFTGTWKEVLDHEINRFEQESKTDFQSLLIKVLHVPTSRFGRFFYRGSYHREIGPSTVLYAYEQAISEWDEDAMFEQLSKIIPCSDSDEI